MLSSVAERMYWMGRYLERAENTARLVNVYTTLLLDLPKDSGVSWDQMHRIAGCEADFARVRSWPYERNAVKFVVSSPDNSSSIFASLSAARENVRTLRDIVPREGFESITDLYRFGQKYLPRAAGQRSRQDILDGVIERCQQVAGLLDGTMSHNQAYEFWCLGRTLERADMTTRIVDVAGEMLTSHPETYAEHETVLWINVLRSLSAYQMYRQSVRSRITPVRVLHFVINDDAFPRSFRFCLNDLELSVGELPNHTAVSHAIETAEQQLSDIGLRDLASPSLHAYIDVFQVALIAIHDAIRATWFLPEESRPAVA